MKKTNFKTTLFPFLLLMSAFCFVYVNTSTIATESTATTMLPNSEINTTQVQDSKLPDMKILQTVINLLTKYTNDK